jgi:heme/copper-type cytochrome/quinol oxidase subunit 1
MNDPKHSHQPPRRAPIRRLSALAGIIALLALVAGVAILASGSGQTAEFGWFAYAPMSGGAFDPGMLFLGPQQITGWLLVVLAACAAAFWAGLRLGRRSR